jgi:hypothetical protein
MDVELFWAKVEKTETCWNWIAGRAGGKAGKEYGKFSYRDNGKLKHPLAHRVAFELAGNKLIPGMQIDHMCHNKLCVNPAHLRQVTQSQNQQHRRTANRTSETGILGVSANRGYGKPWQTQVKVNGKAISAGHYDTVEEAEKAVIALRNKLYTHNDHDPKEQSA